VIQRPEVRGEHVAEQNVVRGGAGAVAHRGLMGDALIVTTTAGRGAGLVVTGACLSVARKLLKRGYHTLCELNEAALQPA
jgi:hypothetical protein